MTAEKWSLASIQQRKTATSRKKSATGFIVYPSSMVTKPLDYTLLFYSAFKEKEASVVVSWMLHRDDAWRWAVIDIQFSTGPDRTHINDELGQSQLEASFYGFFFSYV